MIQETEDTTICTFAFAADQTCPNDALPGSDFCHQHAGVVWGPIYKETAEHLRQDLREFWSRNGFFLIIQGALFSVFATLDPQGAPTAVGRASELLPVLGGLIALIWFWIAWWSVVWVLRWHEAFLKVEALVDPFQAHFNAGQRVQRVSAVQTAAVLIPGLFATGWAFVSWNDQLLSKSSGSWWSTGVVLLMFFVLEVCVLVGLTVWAWRADSS